MTEFEKARDELLRAARRYAEQAVKALEAKTCARCGGSGKIDVGKLNWAECPDCQRKSC
ncbi:MAG: hypothetical protein ACYTBJ_01805 [Planctomycetota bacterium]|jgi:hypothetical protein